MSEYNIIGDIAGNFNTLRLLLKRMPDATPISVGDMVDRGPRSRPVLEFFMHYGHAVLGNHEAMFLAAINDPFNVHQWLANGGKETRANFTNSEGKFVVPEGITDWLSGLPLYIRDGELLITHAPCARTTPRLPDPNMWTNDQYSEEFVWSRWPPRHEPGRINIYGHNAQHAPEYSRAPNEDGYVLNDTRPYAICIDTSRARILTGIHWPSLEIFQQEIVD